ncbi:MAG: tRNA (guanosine(37)-N1)-methyltransferase TrmD [Clostridiaceae bacterium]|nr:tRNA (guanosine(37)-N1)-methyltransferase TrmD [Clostridiaceae bacterium]
MKLTVLTLFPELIEQIIGSSITGRARDAGLFTLETVQIRDFAVNRYGKVDDYCFGGGTGMLMMAEPIYQAWRSVQNKTAAAADPDPDAGQSPQMAACRSRTIYLSPRGAVFTQAHAAKLAQYDQLIFLCGHYEGVDQRVLDEIVDEEISIGDYVLTGGELAACVVIDALLRLVPGVLPDESAYTRESHTAGLLEYPQYTRPAEWHGHVVPDVLLSGHQANIERWQLTMARLETMCRRPDLFNRIQMDAEAWQQLIDAVQREK